MHAFVNELERPIGTYLYGRGLYEVMLAWETAETLPDQSPPRHPGLRADMAGGRQGRLLPESSARTRIEREFDPEAVQRMKESAERDLSVGGPGLAAHALEAGQVDECHLFLSPVVVGGGKQALPDGVRLGLELLDKRRFADGVVHLHYRTR